MSRNVRSRKKKKKTKGFQVQRNKRYFPGDGISQYNRTEIEKRKQHGVRLKLG
jgi:TnpA family transposase